MYLIKRHLNIIPSWESDSKSLLPAHFEALVYLYGPRWSHMLIPCKCVQVNPGHINSIHFAMLSTIHEGNTGNGGFRALMDKLIKEKNYSLWSFCTLYFLILKIWAHVVLTNGKSFWQCDFGIIELRCPSLFIESSQHLTSVAHLEEFKLWTFCISFVY